jgi:predicted O-methyltransferase YrrM
MISITDLDSRVKQRLQESPLLWDERMRRWSPRESYLQTIASNDQAYYLYLNALVADTRPRTVLELGTCQGGSALFMLLALPAAGKLMSCDLGHHQPVYLEPFRSDSRLTLMIGDTRDPGLYKEIPSGSVDLLFIDTDHTCAQVTKEWELSRRLMGPGGIVAMDDIHMNDMGLFWNPTC